MALNFLDDMSFFDHRRQQMRFVAHDGPKAVTFHIDLDAFYPRLMGIGAEPDYVSAFERKIDVIHSAARIAYASGGRSVYVLSRRDLV